MSSEGSVEVMADVSLESFEQKIERLQQIVKQLDEGTLPLHEGMKLYKEGVDCAKSCRKLLDDANHQLTIWRDGEEQDLNLPQDKSE